MGIFDWLTTPRKKFNYTGNNEAQHLTANELGEKFAQWGSGHASLITGQLKILGSIRENGDSLSKINNIPSHFFIQCTALLTAAYSVYPILRLGIDNRTYSEIVNGIAKLFRSRAASTHGYIQQTSDDVESILIAYGKYVDQFLGEIGQLDKDNIAGIRESALASIILLLNEINGSYQPVQFKKDASSAIAAQREVMNRPDILDSLNYASDDVIFSILMANICDFYISHDERKFLRSL